MLSTRVSLSATLGSFPICSSVFRTPNCPALVRSFRTSRLRSRSHPLRQQQRPETNKALYSQKWSTRTLVLLATFVGATSYTLVQAQKHPALLDLDALRVPSPTQNDFDIAFTKVSAALPEDCVATDDVSLQACVAPWSCKHPRYCSLKFSSVERFDLLGRCQCRSSARRSALPTLDPRCADYCQDCQRARHSSHSILRSYQLRRACSCARLRIWQSRVVDASGP